MQIIGYVEYTYIMQMEEKERTTSYEKFMSSGIPCVIFTTLTEPSAEMLDIARKYNVPTLVTERTTNGFMAEIIRWLEGSNLRPAFPYTVFWSMFTAKAF